MDSEKSAAEKHNRSMQDTLYVLNGKWKLPILIAIREGCSRFREIQRTVKGITSKVLSKELKELEQNKLIIRTVHDDISINVEYTSSPYCKTMAPMIKEMIAWGEAHREELKNP